MRVAAFALVALLTTAAANPPPVVAIHAEGDGLVAPALVRLRVTVAPNKDNRDLWVAIEADGYAAAHYEQLDGAHAPITRWVEFKATPAGAYTAWARVIRARGETSASDTFLVEGDYADDCQHFNAIGDCLDPDPVP